MGDPEKTKKIILFAIAGIVIFAVILVIILSITSSASAAKNNLVLDGTTSKLDTTILTNDESGNLYFSIERIAPILSYEFYNGEYGKATEDRTKCYVKNANELVSFDMDSNNIYKLLLTNADSLYEKYTLTLPIKRINDKLYVSLQGMQRAFNVSAAYDAEKNVLTINTLPYLYAGYNTQVKELGYTSLAEEFVNQKAILSGLLVVVKDREYYGVISTTGETVIGTKYKKIEFMENTTEFLVQNNGKYGILTKDAVAKVDTTYDELKVIDSDTGLYLAKSNEKYGVLKRDGNVLLYLQYDYIGVKDIASFPNDNIKNPYILFDSAIPVNKDGKWGFYGLDGSTIMEPKRITTLGCISTTNRNEAHQNLLIIPASEGAEGIVVGTTSSTNKTTYGIYSLQHKRYLTPTTFSRIYRDVVNGDVSYYMIFSGQISSVKSRISSNISSIGEGNSTVTVNPGTSTQNNALNNNISNTLNNTVGNNIQNNISGNAINNPTTDNSISNQGQDNVIHIDPDSTDPIIIQ